MRATKARNRSLTVIIIVSIHIFSLYFLFLVQNRPRIRIRKYLLKKVEALSTTFHLAKIGEKFLPKNAFAENRNRNRSIPVHYPNLEQLYARIQTLVQQHSSLLALERIGSSTTLGYPIYAIKLSDNPQQEEDESAVLFTGLHHAREPMGTLMCLRIIESLISQYTTNAKTRNLVDNLEIWLVPVVNPDGYKYMMDNDVPFPWWRKNLHDNDQNGVFDPIVDGVDLNRNYDFNWQEGGESNPASWFYHGKRPFSETEIAAIKALAIRENIMAGISFHSYGEVVLYPWGNFDPAPDRFLLVDIATQMAARMNKISAEGEYGILPLNGRVGQSSVWMYGRLRAIDYIVELGDEHFPNETHTENILAEGFKGVLYFLNRVTGAGIRGHVVDKRTREPIVAKILIKGKEAGYVAPRSCERVFGRFERILLPGQYTLTVVAPGYERKTLPGISVFARKPTQLNIAITKIVQPLPIGNN